MASGTKISALSTTSIFSGGEVFPLVQSGTTKNATITSLFSAPVIITPKIQDTSADHQYSVAVSELAANRTVTLPLLGGNDTFVFEAHTQTLTNKTLTSPTISGGTIDGAVIGGSNPAAGTFTTLVVDTTTLVVDATNNRVGIGTASPEAALTLRQTGGGFANGFRMTNNIGNHYRDWLVASTGDFQFGYDGTEFARIDPNSNLLWNGAATPASAVGAIVPFNGTAPTGSVVNGFAMYSADQTAGNAAPHFRTENGSIIILFEGAALTAADANALNTGDATSDTVIGNMRTRIGELEARLQAHGLLA